ncbi:probable N-acetyltransferase HLS1 [Asparagus officinalis]|nr:probable N-acetyltransferase HLS1 [Asparagus officinalis]
MGIALNLVNKIEAWFRAKGAEYAYMATEKDNEASLNLFTARCGYSKFRTPSVLVQPVYAHRISKSRHVSVFQIPAHDAETLYRKKFATNEFFPRDIDSILNNPVSLGTFVAVNGSGFEWDGPESFLRDPPESWAVLSVWNSKAVFRLEVKGVSKWKRGFAKTSRIMDKVFPWLKLPSVPDLFKPFGFYFLYGFGGEGKRAADLIRVLCGHAHNMALDDKCGLVVAEAEVAACEPLRSGVPHWKMLCSRGPVVC